MGRTAQRVVQRHALYGLAGVVRDQGDYSLARSLYRESAAKYRATGNEWSLGLLLNSQGELERLYGDYQQARKFYEESIESSRTHGQKTALDIALENLGFVWLRLGDLSQARTLFVESIVLTHQLGRRDSTCMCLLGLAGILAATGKLEHAAQLVGAADAAIRAYQLILQPADRIEHDRIAESVRAQVDEVHLARMQALGEQMTLEQAVDYAMEHVNFHDAKNTVQSTAHSAPVDVEPRYQ